MIILGTNSIKDTGFNVANSCRFNDGDSAYMHKTPGSAGNRRKFTFSCWIKKGDIAPGDDTCLFSGDNSGDDSRPDDIRIRDTGKLYVSFRNTNDGIVSTKRVLRDPSAWMNIVVAVDTEQSTAENRVKIYINGVQESNLEGDGSGSPTYPSEDHDCTGFGRDTKITVGARSKDSPDKFFDGYMAEVCYIDGSQLAATSFGEFDEDSPTIWKPKDVSGLTFGTNGFYLDFEDSSNLGNDANGGTDLTEVNLAATDQATDTCTNNFATFNPLDQAETGTAIVFSQGNCKGVTAVDTTAALQSTIAVSSGKWYAEFKVTKVGDNLSGGRTTVGIGSRNNASVNGHYYGNTASPVDSYGKYSASAHYYSNNGSTTSYGSSFVDDDIIGVYLDLDNNKLYFSENGTLYSSTGISITAAASTLNGHYHIGFSDASANDNGEVEANYGGCPAFTISSAVSDDNGYGSFEYSPNITGDGEAKKFYALCTKNLAEFGG